MVLENLISCEMHKQLGEVVHAVLGPCFTRMSKHPDPGFAQGVVFFLRPSRRKNM